MSVASVITSGYGTYGSIPLVILDGFSSGAGAPVGLPPKRKFYEARDAEQFDYLRDDEDVVRLLMEALPGIIKAQLKRRKK